MWLFAKYRLFQGKPSLFIYWCMSRCAFQSSEYWIRSNSAKSYMNNLSSSYTFLRREGTLPMHINNIANWDLCHKWFCHWACHACKIGVSLFEGMPDCQNILRRSENQDACWFVSTISNFLSQIMLALEKTWHFQHRWKCSKCWLLLCYEMKHSEVHLFLLWAHMLNV